ncbi:DMT family transporter [Campylobacter sputorum]|nr:SMR family transporter [Campylobacter sputorum]KAB0582438.1 multidrug transporter [Campylobacter sputorum subsp. sputorum]
MILVLAGILEMPSVYFNVKFNEAKNILQKLFAVFMIILTFGSSVLLLRYAMQEIPMSVAYSIWTAVGVLGAVFVGVVFRDEKMSVKKSFFIIIIIFSAIMLKII